MQATEVHVIDRTDRPRKALAEIASVASEVATIVDLSTGRADAVSVLSDEYQESGRHWQWISGTEYADRIAYKSQDNYIRWVAEVGSRPILDGKSIKEWFVYDDEISLWWYTKTATKGQISSPYRWIFYTFALIDELIESREVARGAEWHFWVQDAASGEVFQQYLGERGRVVIHASDSTRPIKPDWGTLRRRVITPILHIVNALKLHFETRSERRPVLRDLGITKSPVHLMVTEFSRSWRPISKEESFEERVRSWDFYMGGLPWDLTKMGLDVRWLIAASGTRDFRRWKEKGAVEQNLPDVSALATLTPRKCAGIMATHIRWCRTFDHLFVDNDAHRSLRYGDVDMSHWIVKDFADLCLGSGVSTLIKIEQYRRVAELVRPSAVLYRDEMFRSGRQISAGMAGRTRRIGIQHGIINRESTVYRFHPDEVASEQNLVACCPVPDTFAAFGEFVRELFEQWNGYDPNRVVPIGGPRHDNIVRQLVPAAKDRAAMRASIRAKLGIPTDSNVVLLCTQRARDAGAWFDLVIRGLRSAGVDAFVAVKTHHYHGGEEEVREVAAKQAFGDYAIFSFDTYPLIASADVVVGGPSTIILEANLLNRPAISISSSDAFETYPYREERIGRLVSTVSDMTAALRGRIQDEHETDDDFSRHRRIICARHLWNDDAGAGLRLGSLLSRADAKEIDPAVTPL